MSDNTSEGEKARNRVVEMLETGPIGDAALPEAARVLEPIRVAEPDVDGLHSWFVPVAVGDRLAGFAELLPDLELARYSSFQRRPGDAVGLPDLAAWTDPETIRQRAGRGSHPDETLGEPILTYDREPARLAWRVRATDPEGHSRSLFVAGDYVYEQPA